MSAGGRTRLAGCSGNKENDECRRRDRHVCDVYAAHWVYVKPCGIQRSFDVEVAAVRGCRWSHARASGPGCVMERATGIGVDLAAVEAAAARIAPHARVTPVMTSRRMDAELSGGETAFWFKCEMFQRTGSFKFRGALNALSILKERMPGGAVVVTHSSGNHGQAVASAAGLLDMRAHIVVPRGAPRVKVEAVEGYGAVVSRCGRSGAERAAAANRVVDEVRGAVLVHAFQDPGVIAGQGTIALELLEQVEGLEAIVVPVGGGGMISGIAIAAKALCPTIRIFGAEPLAADDAARSFRAKKHLSLSDDAPATVADGLRAGLGAPGWQVLSSLVEDVFTADEDEIVAYTKLVWRTMKVVIEPSAGVGVAVAASPAFRRLGLKKVAIILCGGNVDLDTFR